MTDQAHNSGAGEADVKDFGLDIDTLRKTFTDHIHYSRGRELETATARDRYVALALSVRDRLVDRWAATRRAYASDGGKQVYYLSAEFLMGRALLGNLQALGIEDRYRDVLAELGVDLSWLLEQEPEPGLGNGGLGRLAACFLESMATLALPGQGYGIRYEFGIFEQVIRNGEQVERADEWLRLMNPWEIARPEDSVHVRFGGHTENVPDGHGSFRVLWHAADTVLGLPHDTPVAGFRNNTVNTLRLWSAKASQEFDLQLFNAGDYVRAVEGKNASEVISKVLYPNDNFQAGRELRLRQEYFFVSCSIQDIVRKHLTRHQTLERFSAQTAIQLNDTHPAVAIAELMRVLMDDHGLAWDPAWKTTVETFGFTNHTLMPEALERWPVELFERLLPRHLEIIREIDQRFLEELEAAYPQDRSRVQAMSIIDQQDPQQIHMARLAVVGSHAVNGVAALHTQLLRTRVMRPFAEHYPTRFSNKTNGVTPRRWLLACNPQLSALFNDTIGDGWLTDLEKLQELEEYADEPEFLSRLMATKKHHKRQLADEIHGLIDVSINPDAIFDVQIKRLHEYKRQLLNVMHIVALYLRIKRGEPVVPRVFVFGAKAAPGYRMAKHIIRLIHSVASLINDDPEAEALKVAFMPNYRVTLAERIIPAADLSEQISTAGKEASGTGNMKLTMNGALTIGTLDGANIEIRDAVGEENFFLFGMTVDEVHARRKAAPGGRDVYQSSAELKEVVDHIRQGFFNPDTPDLYQGLMDSLLDHDEYMVFGDFESYVACQERVANTYQQEKLWARMVALNIARVGRFSSDRTIRQYASEIWGISPIPVVL